MATTKTATLIFYIDPRVKEALCTAADREYLSRANMVTVSIYPEWKAGSRIGVEKLLR